MNLLAHALNDGHRCCWESLGIDIPTRGSIVSLLKNLDGDISCAKKENAMNFYEKTLVEIKNVLKRFHGKNENDFNSSFNAINKIGMKMLLINREKPSASEIPELLRKHLEELGVNCRLDKTDSKHLKIIVDCFFQDLVKIVESKNCTEEQCDPHAVNTAKDALEKLASEGYEIVYV